MVCESMRILTWTWSGEPVIMTQMLLPAVLAVDAGRISTTSSISKSKVTAKLVGEWTIHRARGAEVRSSSVPGAQRRVVPTPRRANVPPTQWLKAQTAAPALHTHTRWARRRATGCRALMHARVADCLFALPSSTPGPAGAISARVASALLFLATLCALAGCCYGRVLGSHTRVPTPAPLDVRLHTRRGAGPTRDGLCSHCIPPAGRRTALVLTRACSGFGSCLHAG